MFKRLSELSIPPGVKQDPDAAELLRLWFADGQPRISLANGVWEDPEPWGMLLSDLAEHIADTYVQFGGRDKAEVLQQIRRGLDEQWPKA